MKALLTLLTIMVVQNVLAQTSKQELLEDDLRLVSNVLADMTLKYTGNQKAPENKLNALNTLLLDLESRIKKDYYDCANLKSFKKSVRSFNVFSENKKVELQDYYGDGECRSYPPRSCVTYSRSLKAPPIPFVSHSRSKYDVVSLCVDEINESGRYTSIKLDKEVSSKLVEVLSRESINIPNNSAVSIRLDVEEGKVVSELNNIGNLGGIIENTSKLLESFLFSKHKSYSFKLSNLAVNYDYSDRENQNDKNGNPYLTNKVPCNLEYSVKLWNSLPYRERKMKTIRCNVESINLTLNNKFKSLLKGNPYLGGKMIASIQILPDGQVRSSATKTELSDEFTRYILTELNKIKFPRMSNEVTELEYLFFFGNENKVHHYGFDGSVI